MTYTVVAVTDRQTVSGREAVKHADKLIDQIDRIFVYLWQLNSVAAEFEELFSAFLINNVQDVQ